MLSICVTVRVRRWRMTLPHFEILEIEPPARMWRRCVHACFLLIPVHCRVPVVARGDLSVSFTMNRPCSRMRSPPRRPRLSTEPIGPACSCSPRPHSRKTASDGNVVDAIRRGAAATGSDFDYLLKTAQRESALDPQARAPTSSATGLFQFIEQTWLGMVKSEGPRFGLDEEARAISRGTDGQLSVSDPALRREILSLRENPGVAAKLAGALTQSNGAHLANALGREPRPADLYVAHFLGARGAVDLIDAATRDPARSAAAMFPQAARANPSIFFDHGGWPRAAQARSTDCWQRNTRSSRRRALQPAESAPAGKRRKPRACPAPPSMACSSPAGPPAPCRRKKKKWPGSGHQGPGHARPHQRRRCFFPRADGGTMGAADSIPAAAVTADRNTDCRRAVAAAPRRARACDPPGPAGPGRLHHGERNPDDRPPFSPLGPRSASPGARAEAISALARSYLYSDLDAQEPARCRDGAHGHARRSLTAGAARARGGTGQCA